MVVVTIEILVSTSKVAAAIIITVRSCGHTVICICNYCIRYIGSAAGLLQGILQQWSSALLLSNYDFN